MRLPNLALLLTTITLAPPPARAATPPADSARAVPVIHAARLAGAIRVDGRLDEPAWAAAVPETSFTQLDPLEGRPASERTEVRVLVDDDALYVGARLFDREAARVKGLLARRDDPSSSDLFEVFLDSYHDHLTAWRFRVNPAGALRDAAIAADGSENASWDPVWQAQAQRDSGGWSAEMRIPLSQLRYTAGNEVWGINFARGIFRRGESDFWAFTPKKEQGGVARYGHLVDLGRLRAPRQLELVPYALSRNERLQFKPGDPFRSGSDYFGAAGLDLKYGLTSDLTLAATFNPDFGQVEVDPAEVNLTAFETFYDEKRPFFVERADLFAFGQSRAYNNYGLVKLFHSRRVGRAPTPLAPGPAVKFSDTPDQTTIAGAAKLTGKTRGGWSVGLLDAITAEEDARWVDTLDLHRESPVEPLTHYFAGRLQRELRGGNTVVGGLLTAVNRRLDDPALEAGLRREAYVGGLDLNHAWGDHRWAFDADLAGTLLRGSPSAIALAQRSSARYFQRPDHAGYATYDPTRTALKGGMADASLTKTSGEHWLASLAYVSKTPGFEANDLGYHTRADFRALSEMLIYMENKPNRLFRNSQVAVFTNQAWNFGNDRIFNGAALDFVETLPDFWSLNGRATWGGRITDDRLTRGGPQALAPRDFTWQAGFDSDTRKTWSAGAFYKRQRTAAGGRSDAPSLTFSFRPSPALRLGFKPSYTISHGLAQYVTAVPDPAATATYGTRYVFATLDQRVLNLETRLDWTFTPRLSLQLYVQPLVVSGDFSSFKELARPRSFDFVVYGRDRGSVVPDGTGGWIVDPGNGASFGLPNLDFNFRSLLGNAVLRWEYRPGSTLYVVWQQRRTDFQDYDDFDFRRDYAALFQHRPENVYVVKATYWIGL